MSRSLVFRPQARREFDAAGDWHEREQPGLGATFLAEVDQVLRLIASSPDAFPEVLDGVRKAVVRRFPYCLYFRVRGETIVVLAVFHSARNPKIWQARR
ncbi:MAG: type II toxin-antitoxin system RelE/ParE family toxin [Pseudomonadota bacterium]